VRHLLGLGFQNELDRIELIDEVARVPLQRTSKITEVSRLGFCGIRAFEEIFDLVFERRQHVILLLNERSPPPRYAREALPDLEARLEGRRQAGSPDHRAYAVRHGVRHGQPAYDA
jgi:hypothetical protein